MEYEMSSAILMKSGYTTGATFVGHSDFELGDDVISKLHYGTCNTSRYDLLFPPFLIYRVAL